MQNDRLPLYMQIQDYFKEKIISHKLKVNDKIPSEKELMEQFRVSRITVANALVQLAKEGWIDRIPGRGSFVKEVAAEVKSGMTDSLFASAPDERQQGSYMAARERGAGDLQKKTVGVIIPTLVDFFALRLITGINEVLKAEGYHLFISLSNNCIETEKKLILESLANGTSGLIIFPSDAETYNEEIIALKMSHYPFVLIDRNLAGIDTNFVCTDSMNGTKLALNHLWELGHREIAICSDTPLPTITVSDRIAGYMEALMQHGAMINPAMILTDFQVDYSSISEDHPLFRFIRNRMATAYITLNARLGIYISTVAKQIGLKVPDDISILTFDNPSSGYDEFGTFTHISQSETCMGRQAAEILMKLLEEGEPASKYSKVVLQPELVVRASTGVVKTTV
ncbi:GntR family transcriptional regulator of arabinose operon [Paenibacillus castaneae]|uniref:GntR family transcriptional regulator n=1 Tax=Paenibacillus castaneae TaxID=474957 RepID=UPI000C9ADE5F|nr:GntR family transcriptional regulator [Paenibacillus castaneae]NIK75105.1 GntR family transcriptional regulator of arabinose operon [Paenibacillus castaneae]